MSSKQNVSVSLHQLLIQEIKGGRYKKFEKLLKEVECINVNEPVIIPGRNGWTLLHHASYKGHVRTVKALLAKNAEVNVKTDKGETPLLLACNLTSYYGRNENRIEIVKLLLAHDAEVNIQTYYDKSEPFYYYAETALHYACFSRSLKLVQLLLGHKADVHIRDGRGETPLHRASTDDFADIRILRILIAHGADVNSKNIYDWTPLCLVCCWGSENTAYVNVPFLLQNGVNLSIKIKSRETAEDETVETVETVEEFVKRESSHNIVEFFRQFRLEMRQKAFYWVKQRRNQKTINQSNEMTTTDSQIADHTIAAGRSIKNKTN